MTTINPMLAAHGGPGSVTKTIFDYTGTSQYFTVPWGVHEINVKLWAAGGASETTAPMSGGDWGGSGGFVSGKLAVVPGEVLEIISGQAGIPDSPIPTYGGGGPAGGVGVGYRGGSGGGRSSIRRGGVDIVTAGGGGGGGNVTNGATGGGVGGGLVGGNAPNLGYGAPGLGGTQIAGGASGGDDATDGNQHQGGQGGTAAGTSGTSGGGGGGKYGGGGGNAQGGGGGSSDVSNLTGTVQNLQGSGWSPPNTADGDYYGTIARGGRGVENPPGHGRVVIY